MSDDDGARRRELLQWYDAHKRALPWRATRDAYAVWVSEVMLQQTRVETVLPYYQRFLERFPTVQSLADAPEEQVLTAWAGLGYYRRARLLQQGARAVVREHGGALPDEPAALRALPGVGAYTAGALASIAFGRAEPLVDGNVERVLTRWYALAGDPKRAPLKNLLWQRAAALVQGERPGDFNQALMELGATVCTPAAPRCLVCPVRSHCEAHKRGESELFPSEIARKAPPFERWWAALVRSHDGARVWLARSAGPRWRGCLVPLVWRREPEVGPEVGLARLVGEGAAGLERHGLVRQLLTAASTEYEVLSVRADAVGAAAGEGQWLEHTALDAHPVPKVTRLVLAALNPPAAKKSKPRKA